MSVITESWLEKFEESNWIGSDGYRCKATPQFDVNIAWLESLLPLKCHRVTTTLNRGRQEAAKTSVASRWAVIRHRFDDTTTVEVDKCFRSHPNTVLFSPRPHSQLGHQGTSPPRASRQLHYISKYNKWGWNATSACDVVTWNIDSNEVCLGGKTMKGC